MSGNVWEWCGDWYDVGAYGRYKKGDLESPKSENSRVLRGGSWYYDLTVYFRCAYRRNFDPGFRCYYSGFRCAKTF